MERNTGYYNTFVVKIWSDEAAKTIRGYIQHVSTQEQSYFLSLGNIADFIAKHLGPPPGDSAVRGKGTDVPSIFFDGIGDIDD